MARIFVGGTWWVLAGPTRSRVLARVYPPHPPDLPHTASSYLSSFLFSSFLSSLPSIPHSLSLPFSYTLSFQCGGRCGVQDYGRRKRKSGVGLFWVNFRKRGGREMFHLWLRIRCTVLSAVSESR
ncbi:hypothetical protein E2C01_102859 [Portunus trituberculatus]|uniref:Uncharacterized protein n=1 Tax=Portunus trituberculatus TaxID=210409 RepID=A0A5B7KNI5_PORTR|nr:hypothetical protein [Portunus trituberculatus]